MVDEVPHGWTKEKWEAVCKAEEEAMKAAPVASYLCDKCGDGVEFAMLLGRPMRAMPHSKCGGTYRLTMIEKAKDDSKG